MNDTIINNLLGVLQEPLKIRFASYPPQALSFMEVRVFCCLQVSGFYYRRLGGGDICTLDPSQSKLVYSVYHAPKCFKSDGWENRISCVHVVGPLNEEGRWCGRGEVPR